MIADWDKRYPGRVENLFRGLQNIVPSHLMDKELHPFAVQALMNCLHTVLRIQWVVKMRLARHRSRQNLTFGVSLNRMILESSKQHAQRSEAVTNRTRPKIL